MYVYMNIIDWTVTARALVTRALYCLVRCILSVVHIGWIEKGISPSHLFT